MTIGATLFLTPIVIGEGIGGAWAAIACDGSTRSA